MRDIMLYPTPTQDHHDGLGLNDALTIVADARDPKAGNASHRYSGHMDNGDDELCEVIRVQFQHGARTLEGSTPGALDAALVTILLDRYRGFQEGPFKCKGNAMVSTKLEEALLWMKDRSFKRHQQGVLGTDKAHK